MGPTSRAVAAALALAFLVLHLPYTPRSLEDVDSINFALGIRDFDVAEHQPHPPGYPVFILIAKAVNAVTNSEVLTLSTDVLLVSKMTATFDKYKTNCDVADYSFTYAERVGIASHRLAEPWL